MKVVLICSVLLNAVLAGHLLVTSLSERAEDSDRQHSPASVSEARMGQFNTANRLAAATELQALHSRLLASGVDAGLAKRLVLFAAQSEIPAPLFEYWRPEYVRRAEEEIFRWEVNVSTGAVLTQIFGADATNDPVFAAVFAPLDRELPSLASATQREVQRLRIEGLRELVGLPFDERLPASRARVQQSTHKRIESLLAPAELFEYRLRYSGLARSLLSVDFDFTETEFRDAFLALSKTQRQDGAEGFAPFRVTATGYEDAVTQELRSKLGPERFRKYEMLQDPRYKVLQALSSTFALPPGKVAEAYSTIKSTDAQVETLQGKGPVLSVDSRAKLTSALQARDQRLRQLLGDAAYEVAAPGLRLSVDSLGVQTSSSFTPRSRTAVPMRATP